MRALQNISEIVWSIYTLPPPLRGCQHRYDPRIVVVSPRAAATNSKWKASTRRSVGDSDYTTTIIQSIHRLITENAGSG